MTTFNYFDCLPDMLTQDIMAYVLVRAGWKSFLNFSSASSHLRKLLYEPHPLLQDSGVDPFDTGHLKKYMFIRPRFNHLISHVGTSKLRTLKWGSCVALSTFHNLRCLSITIDDELVRGLTGLSFIPRLPQLVELHVRNDAINTLPVVLSFPPGLRALKLTGTSPVIPRVPQGLPALESLYVNTPGVDMQSVDPTIAFPRLVKCQVVEGVFTNSGLRKLLLTGKMHSWCGKTKCLDDPQLVDMSSLRELSLGIVKDASYPSLESLTNLRDLTLSLKASSAVCWNLRNAKQLRELAVEASMLLGGSGIAWLQDLPRGIQKLSINSPKSIDVGPLLSLPCFRDSLTEIFIGATTDFNSYIRFTKREDVPAFALIVILHLDLDLWHSGEFPDLSVFPNLRYIDVLVSSCKSVRTLAKQVLPNVTEIDLDEPHPEYKLGKFERWPKLQRITVNKKPFMGFNNFAP